MTPWLLLLFFIAIALGYVLGRGDSKRQQQRQLDVLGNGYARGITFLLDEQPDKAVAVLLESLVVNEHTLETYLALARVFRRRGEMDRATRIHENLLTTTGLSRTAREDVQLELALDFLMGGVFDRAEQLLVEMIECESHHQFTAMRHLMQIFEQEKDWHSALAVGVRLLEQEASVAHVLAHYCCELAEHQHRNGAGKAARRTLRRALHFDKQCARAWLVRGRMEMAEGLPKAALAAYAALYELNAELFDEALPEVEAVYRLQQGDVAWLRFLADACLKQPSTARVLRLVAGLEQHQGEEEAARLLVEYLKRSPSTQGLQRFLEMRSSQPHEVASDPLHLLRQLAEQLPSEGGQYRCADCGFQATRIHWQCPSCKHWGAVKLRTNPFLT